HAGFVQRRVEEALFVGGEVVAGLVFEDGEGVDLVFGHVEVDAPFGALAAELAHVEQGLGEGGLDEGGEGRRWHVAGGAAGRATAGLRGRPAGGCGGGG